MADADDSELFRLCAELEQIGRSLPGSDPKREALKKAALALHIVFDRGFRQRLEEQYNALANPRVLTQAERAHLISLGIDPDAD